mmetsp:Transcript_3557/g.22355  ORF Transcript_3557/g.22355 Transcript_3557/m.22355 type:complete len:212 (+) Transcript_3557:286-921(+)
MVSGICRRTWRRHNTTAQPHSRVTPRASLVPIGSHPFPPHPFGGCGTRNGRDTTWTEVDPVSAWADVRWMGSIRPRIVLCRPEATQPKHVHLHTCKRTLEGGSEEEHDGVEQSESEHQVSDGKNVPQAREGGLGSTLCRRSRHVQAYDGLEAAPTRIEAFLQDGRRIQGLHGKHFCRWKTIGRRIHGSCRYRAPCESHESSRTPGRTRAAP